MAAGGYFAITLPLRYLVRHSALCFASSPADIPVIESLGGRREQVHIVPNGVEPTFLVPQPEEDLRRTRETYGLPSDRPLLLFVGHVRPKKGVDTLIEALTRVPGEWHAAIVGPHTFPRLAAELQEKVRRHGLEEAITFTEAVSFTELKSLYQLADVCLFPSRVETFPLTVLEAMAKGRAVIATRVGGIAYQLEDDAGILVEPDDSEGLTAAIRTLLEDPERRARMGEAGRARLEREFTWQRAAELAVDGYEKAIGEHCP